MLESALCACFKPSQDDWLNDLSSRPPVSVTIQAEKAPAPAVGLDEPPPPPPLPALAHPAASSASTLSAVAALNVPLTSTSSAGAALLPPESPACVPARPAKAQCVPEVPPRDVDQESITATGVAVAGKPGSTVLL